MSLFPFRFYFLSALAPTFTLFPLTHVNAKFNLKLKRKLNTKKRAYGLSPRRTPSARSPSRSQVNVVLDEAGRVSLSPRSTNLNQFVANDHEGDVDHLVDHQENYTDDIINDSSLNSNTINDDLYSALKTAKFGHLYEDKNGVPLPNLSEEAEETYSSQSIRAVIIDQLKHLSFGGPQVTYETAIQKKFSFIKVEKVAQTGNGHNGQATNGQATCNTCKLTLNGKPEVRIRSKHRYSAYMKDVVVEGIRVKNSETRLESGPGVTPNAQGTLPSVVGNPTGGSGSGGHCPLVNTRQELWIQVKLPYVDRVNLGLQHPDDEEIDQRQLDYLELLRLQRLAIEQLNDAENENDTGAGVGLSGNTSDFHGHPSQQLNVQDIDNLSNSSFWEPDDNYVQAAYTGRKQAVGDYFWLNTAKIEVYSFYAKSATGANIQMIPLPKGNGLGYDHLQVNMGIYMKNLIEGVLTITEPGPGPGGYSTSYTQTVYGDEIALYAFHLATGNGIEVYMEKEGINLQGSGYEGGSHSGPGSGPNIDTVIGANLGTMGHDIVGGTVPGQNQNHCASCGYLSRNPVEKIRAARPAVVGPQELNNSSSVGNWHDFQGQSNWQDPDASYNSTRSSGMRSSSNSNSDRLGDSDGVIMYYFEHGEVEKVQQGLNLQQRDRGNHVQQNQQSQGQGHTNRNPPSSGPTNRRNPPTTLLQGKPVKVLKFGNNNNIYYTEPNPFLVFEQQVQQDAERTGENFMPKTLRLVARVVTDPRSGYKHWPFNTLVVILHSFISAV